VARVALLLITVALGAAIAVATISDIIHHGVSWLDIAALLVVLLFATGICGSLWESIRRR
jgi:drug/metabolite transporter (DMT)-like permease